MSVERAASSDLQLVGQDWRQALFSGFRLEAGKGSLVLGHKKQVQAAEESTNAVIPVTNVETSSSGCP